MGLRYGKTHFSGNRLGCFLKAGCLVGDDVGHRRRWRRSPSPRLIAVIA